MTTLDPALAVIPARGGSKGLPGKNVRKLAGVPLIAHSIACAKRSPRLARTIVSTDSEEIAKVAREHGGDTPFLRPPELARDDTPMFPVLTHALATIEVSEGVSYGSVVLLDPTSPGRLPEDIERAFALLDADPEAVGVIAVSQPHFNPFWVGVIEREGALVPAIPGADRYARRQDVPRFLRINGALYVWRASYIRSQPLSWSEGRHIGLEIPEARAFSIDDLHEFEVLEALVNAGVVRLG